MYDCAICRSQVIFMQRWGHLNRMLDRQHQASPASGAVCEICGGAVEVGEGKISDDTKRLRLRHVSAADWMDRPHDAVPIPGPRQSDLIL